MKPFKIIASEHYKIERFGVMLGVLLVAFALLMGSIGHHKKVVDTNTLSNQVMYTRAAEFSQSGNKVDVVGVYLDSDQTEAFVMLKFADIANMVTDASKYHMFITGADVNGVYEKPLSNPLGAVYVFGSSGYLGLYITDASGFPEQVLSIILRCDETLTRLPEIPIYPDRSFTDHDQINIFFNPGAADFEPAAFLDEDRMDLFDIYEGTVIAGVEDGIKAQMEADLEAMSDALNSIDTYVKNLKDIKIGSRRVLVPPAPTLIRGDKIITVNEGEENEHLEFVTDTPVAGCFNLDWRNHTLATGGYLSELVPDGKDPLRWAEQMFAAGKTAASANVLDDKAIEWKYSDGSDIFNDQSELGLQRKEQIKKNTDLLVKAWAEYYRLKVDYQVLQQQALVRLELDSKDVVRSNSICTDDVVTMWSVR